MFSPSAQTATRPLNKHTQRYAFHLAGRDKIVKRRRKNRKRVPDNSIELPPANRSLGVHAGPLATESSFDVVQQTKESFLGETKYMLPINALKGNTDGRPSDRLPGSLRLKKKKKGFNLI